MHTTILPYVEAVATPVVTISEKKPDARHRDFRHVHKQLGNLAAILRTHVTSTDLTDPDVAAHYAVLRARAIVCCAITSMEDSQ